MKLAIKGLSMAAPLLLVSACTLFPPTLVEQGSVRIDIEKSEPVSVTRATAYRTGGITVIQGEAGYPITTHYGNFRGHIDIDLTLPNGEVFKTRNVALTRKRIPKKRGRKATFSSRFSVDPPKGTVVHIRYHAGPHKADGAT